jgi:hypothetical protein
MEDQRSFGGEDAAFRSAASRVLWCPAVCALERPLSGSSTDSFRPKGDARPTESGVRKLTFTPSISCPQFALPSCLSPGCLLCGKPVVRLASGKPQKDSQDSALATTSTDLAANGGFGATVTGRAAEMGLRD